MPRSFLPWLLPLMLSAQVPESVGPKPGGRLVLPVNQEVTPAGIQVVLPGLRPQMLALSPDGRLALTSGKTAELVGVDPETGQIRQRVAFPAEAQAVPDPVSPQILAPDTQALGSYTGLVFSPDGRWVVLSNVQGSLKVFRVEGQEVFPSHTLALPPAQAPQRKAEIPAGLAFSRDGKRLYVALNLGNGLAELAWPSGQLLRRFEVGVAPYDVALVGMKAYVSNWGGRRPGPGDSVGPAGRGTLVRVDDRGIASEGSVSVVDLEKGILKTELLTGRLASALAVHPKGRYLVCANAGDDTLSVIDTRSDTLVETIWARSGPSDPYGASPNALAFAPDGRTLYVANGTQNAVAVVAFDPKDRESRIQGLIPVGWFPGALALRGRTLLVANVKGLALKEGPKGGFNSHQYTGSLTLVDLPGPKELPRLTAQVGLNLRQARIREAFLPPRPHQPPRPVPERIGEPSPIQHIVYVIKENRTYDQVLGALGKGNGDPRLCIFGEEVTPNQHKLAREFVLLDNTCCSGILSADGHQWSTTAFGNDYLERSFAGWPRSYPDGLAEEEQDALAYAPSGFIWDRVLAAGKSLRVFGEFTATQVTWADGRKGTPSWMDCWKALQGKTGEVVVRAEPSVPPLGPHLVRHAPGWAAQVPDQWRAEVFLQELAKFEAQGTFPNLVILYLPNDHTSGTAVGFPTPAASVADNDLAFGRVVEALSRSSFWKSMVVMAIEDDPQAGWDHVTGYRTTAYVAGPYVKRGAVVSEPYNTTSLLRTMEQILGLRPMNAFDASATPMGACFTETPDFRPFQSVPNRVPLDQMNPDPKALKDPLLRSQSLQSSRLDLRRVDACPEDVLNRILWHAQKGSSAPYPLWAITRTEYDD